MLSFDFLSQGFVSSTFSCVVSSSDSILAFRLRLATTKSTSDSSLEAIWRRVVSLSFRSSSPLSESEESDGFSSASSFKNSAKLQLIRLPIFRDVKRTTGSMSKVPFFVYFGAEAIVIAGWAEVGSSSLSAGPIKVRLFGRFFFKREDLRVFVGSILSFFEGLSSSDNSTVLSSSSSSSLDSSSPRLTRLRNRFLARWSVLL